MPKSLLHIPCSEFLFAFGTLRELNCKGVMDDRQLLQEYIRSQSQEAFRELVARHLPMVYATAHRMVHDRQLAEDVAQNVFATLIQKAGALGASPIVGGWLYNTTRHLAMHAVRTEQRRRQREEAAVAMQPLQTADETSRILEQLEPAMTQLDETERDALVLRYFEDRSLRGVGQELGISEDAARMRVNRALDKLRTVFAGQGIPVTSVLLASVLAASTTTAVPAALSTAIMAAALAGAAAAATTATNVILTSMFGAKTIAAAVGAALLAGTAIYLVQQSQIERLKADNQNLIAQRQQSAADQETASRAAQAAKEELARLRKNNADLLRLRNEVGQLRRERAAQQAVPAAGSGQSAANPGRYISKDQLVFAGYATPEAALQSMLWGVLNGTYEQAAGALAPDFQQQELKDGKSREGFEDAKKTMPLAFKGMQIVARKTLAEDRVELKVRVDVDPTVNADLKMPPFVIEPVLKVGNEWKVAGNPRDYENQWDQDGQIQVLAK